MNLFRSNCPLARALDLVGDKWTLLVLREIVAFQKSTFKELMQMKEGIATNTLADRLEKLHREGLLTKTQSEKHKLVYHYAPTQMAMELFPAVMELRKWSENHLYEEGEEPAAIA